jgi:hypothetical protein
MNDQNPYQSPEFGNEKPAPKPPTHYLVAVVGWMLIGGGLIGAAVGIVDDGITVLLLCGCCCLVLYGLLRRHTRFRKIK